MTTRQGWLNGGTQWQHCRWARLLGGARRKKWYSVLPNVLLEYLYGGKYTWRFTVTLDGSGEKINYRCIIDWRHINSYGYTNTRKWAYQHGSTWTYDDAESRDNPWGVGPLAGYNWFWTIYCVGTTRAGAQLSDDECSAANRLAWYTVYNNLGMYLTGDKLAYIQASMEPFSWQWSGGSPPAGRNPLLRAIWAAGEEAEKNGDIGALFPVTGTRIETIDTYSIAGVWLSPYLNGREYLPEYELSNHLACGFAPLHPAVETDYPDWSIGQYNSLGQVGQGKLCTVLGGLLPDEYA